MSTEALSVSTVVVVTTALAAAFTDVRTFKVYNALTLPVMVGGILFGLFTNGLDGARDSFLGVLVGFALLIIPYSMGAMGAGDVKLLSAFGAWLGVGQTAQIGLIACLLTGVLSLFIIWRRGGFGAAWLNIQVSMLRLQTMGRHLASEGEGYSIQDIKKRPDHRARLIPFSVMLALGVGATLLWGSFF